ncbi:MAG TPA: UDP-N-acetylglucosamine pyrophosphorylase [Clostridiaceae bacterium]|nr:UDP-N-acetylglucosamine pyrophosphorylase [Clostridiaceae bacterium]
MKINVTNLFDLNETIAGSIFDGKEYPWEALRDIQKFILELGQNLGRDFDRVEEDIWIGRGTFVERTAFIKGPAIIGFECEIRHAAYLRGNVIIGNNSVVGNSTEIKNSILFNKVQVPHFNYVGDSILGYKAHFGAGVILSNVKSDKTPVKVRVREDLCLETGLRKFGAMIGDCVEIGCNSVVNPGTIIGRGSRIYPLTSVRGVIPEKRIVKNNGEIVEIRE